MPSPVLSAVDFRDTTLYVVESDGQPYTPLRPIVEGMGLAWQSQYTKVCTNPRRFRVTNIMMQLPNDDQRRSYCCLPLNKLSGWLMSLNAKKIKSSLRPMILAYQEECDDVLWDYWTQQRGIFVEQQNASDNHTLACTCFEELAALFRAIAHLTEHDARALAFLGHERADDWHSFYRQQVRTQ